MSGQACIDAKGRSLKYGKSIKEGWEGNGYATGVVVCGIIALRIKKIMTKRGNT